MLIGDKNALIVAARCSGYGHDYLAGMTCPNCGTNSKQEVDLNEAKELYHGYVESEAEEEVLQGVSGPNASGNYIITLPVTKAEFEVKLMTGAEEKAFSKRMQQRKKRRQAEAMLTDQFKTFTVSINNTGDLRQMYRFIDNLPVRDSRFLRNIWEVISFNKSET